MPAQLDRLDRALEVLGPEGVRDALRRHVQQLAPRERDAFIAVFEAPLDGADPSLNAEVAAYVDDLPAAVEELVEERRWRRHRRRWRSWDDWEDEGDVGPVRASIDDLYRRLGERFLAGDMATAVDGYRRLLGAAAAAVDDPNGIHVGGSDDMAQEAYARLLRALLHDTGEPIERRVAGVIDALHTYRYAATTPTVEEVIEAFPERLQDEREVLRALSAACEDAARSRPGWERRQFHDWAVDLVVRLDGVDGLARLARDATYLHRVETYASWIDGLDGEARTDQAISVATEAVEAVERRQDRARFGDRLAALRRAAGDRSAAARADLAAFVDAPTLWRLRQLCDDTCGTADHIDGLEPVSPELVAATADASDPVVRGAVLVLTGRPADLREVVSAARRTHIADGHDVVALAVGTLLLACRPPADDVPARLAIGLMATVDHLGRPDHIDLLGRRSHESHKDQPSALAPRLVAAVAAQPRSEARLVDARALVSGTAQRVLGAKERGRYGLVARLVVALAHTTQAVDGTPADDVITHYDSEYRRFSAFRNELRTAASEATPTRR